LAPEIYVCPPLAAFFVAGWTVFLRELGRIFDGEHDAMFRDGLENGL
jgi:hypothetical protein